jgi:hypothetical protein
MAIANQSDIIYLNLCTVANKKSEMDLDGKRKLFAKLEHNIQCAGCQEVPRQPPFFKYTCPYLHPVCQQCIGPTYQAGTNYHCKICNANFLVYNCDLAKNLHDHLNIKQESMLKVEKAMTEYHIVVTLGQAMAPLIGCPQILHGRPYYSEVQRNACGVWFMWIKFHGTPLDARRYFFITAI